VGSPLGPEALSQFNYVFEAPPLTNRSTGDFEPPHTSLVKLQRQDSPPMSIGMSAAGEIGSEMDMESMGGEYAFMNPAALATLRNNREAVEVTLSPEQQAALPWRKIATPTADDPSMSPGSEASVETLDLPKLTPEAMANLRNAKAPGKFGSEASVETPGLTRKLSGGKPPLGTVRPRGRRSTEEAHSPGLLSGATSEASDVDLESTSEYGALSRTAMATLTEHREAGLNPEDQTLTPPKMYSRSTLAMSTAMSLSSEASIETREPQFSLEALASLRKNPAGSAKTPSPCGTIQSMSEGVAISLGSEADIDSTNHEYTTLQPEHLASLRRSREVMEEGPTFSPEMMSTLRRTPTAEQIVMLNERSNKRTAENMSTGMMSGAMGSNEGSAETPPGAAQALELGALAQAGWRKGPEPPSGANRQSMDPASVISGAGTLRSQAELESAQEGRRRKHKSEGGDRRPSTEMRNMTPQQFLASISKKDSRGSGRRDHL
jgi:hypothetical protein